MATKTKCYLDTSAIIAFLDRSDSFHPLFRQLFASPPDLITTPLVIAEGQGWFLRRYDTYKALSFISFIESLKPLTIVSVSDKELGAAYKMLRKYSDQALTLTDALGLSIMRTLRIKQCWSTDGHMSLSGVPLVIHL
jgi:predicted nucleic acid-binding protein